MKPVVVVKRCWWSDLPETWCAHCLGQCDTSGELIES